jgi:hypothetical protein
MYKTRWLPTVSTNEIKMANESSANPHVKTHAWQDLKDGGHLNEYYNGNLIYDYRSAK